MHRLLAALFAVALLSYSIPAHLAFAASDTAPASPFGAVEEFVAGLVKGTEAIIASIESTVGNFAASITPPGSSATYTASAAAPEAAPQITYTPTVPAPQSVSAAVVAASPIPTASTPASSDNIFRLQSAIAALTQGVRGLTAFLQTQAPSSKIESQIASLQSTLNTNSSALTYNASSYFPLGDGTGIAAASNIGNLSGVTITNANLSASEIPDLSGSYLSLGGGILTGALIDFGSASSSFAGAVGVGTTSPGSIFAIQGVGNFTVATSTFYSSGGLNILNGCYAVNGTCINPGAVSSQWTTAGSNIFFGTGNIGIGTTSPSRLLTLDSSSATGTILRMSNTSAGGHVYDFLETGSANTGGAGRLDFFDSTAGAARLSIAANGNVGVGTTSPFATFSVVGNMFVTGNATGTNFFGTTGSFTNLFASAGTVSANVSGSYLTATGGNTSLNLNARAGTALTVEDFGAKCDGSTDDTLAFQNAANTGLLISVPQTSTYCKVTGTITLTSGGGFIGSQNGRSTIKLVSGSISRLFDTTNQSTTTIGYLNLDGTNAAANGDFIRYYNGSGNDFSHNIVTNPPGNSGTGAIILVSSATQDTVSYNRFINTYPANTGNAIIDLNGASTSANTINNNYFHGATNFTIRASGGAHDNSIISNTVDSSGLEDVAFSLGTYNNILSNNDLSGSLGVGGANPGDNGVSVVGDHNTISGNQIHGNYASGVYLWGSNNTVIGNTIYDNNQQNTTNHWPCVGSNGNYGATAQGNTITGNMCDDDQATPTQYGIVLGQPNYSTWTSGATVTSGTYWIYGLNVYQSQGSGTTGATPPTCANTSGHPLPTNTCSDGTITWLYQSTFITTPTSGYDTVSGNRVQRYAGAAPYGDSSSIPWYTDLITSETIASLPSLFQQLATGTPNILNEQLTQLRGANGDVIFSLKGQENDASGISRTFAQINLVDNTAANGAENGEIDFKGENNGAFSQLGCVSGFRFIWSPSCASVPLGISNGASGPMFQVANNSGVPTQNGMLLTTYRNSITSPSYLVGAQANSNTIGNLTADVNGSQLFEIDAEGTDSGGDGFQKSSFIRFEVQGNVSAGIVPGLIRFDTTNSIGSSTDAMVINNSQQIGIGTTTPYSRLEVFGPDAASSTSAFAVVSSASSTVFAVFDGGNAQLSGTLTQSSDQRLKTNIQSIDGSSSLAEIKALNPVTFNWIDPEKDGRPQFGFIAQQVQGIFPSLVSTTSPTELTPDGTLGLNYIDLISPIVAAIQELDREITSLASTVAGFAQSITSAVGDFGQVNSSVDNTQELCVQGVCVTGPQLQALLASANQAASAPASPPSSPSDTTDTPPVIEINGGNPAVIQVGASYNDLGATITGPRADLNLGIQSYLNGVLESPVDIDTSSAATDTIAYVVTDSQGLTSTSTRTVIVEPATVPSAPLPAATTSSATSTSQ